MHHSIGCGCKHNRWHPGIAPALAIDPGDTVEMTTRDALDGQVRASMTAADLADVSAGRVHPLTGPVFVTGAEPGDLLEVTIENITPEDHGFTAVIPGLGLLTDLFPAPVLAHWDMENGWATSAQIPGVRLPAAPFMGIMGVAPSLDRLRAVNARETNLGMPPSPEDAIPADPSISGEAWRTIAAHETGGNMDIRQLTAGAKAWFPVDIPGALFSAGDAHFCQGEGESCGTAIEMGARFTARFDLRKGEAHARGQTMPSFLLPPEAPSPRGTKGWFATTALPVTDGAVRPFDASLAARNAVLAMIEALMRDYGLTREQAYIVTSVAGDLRISSIVNVPHAQVSMLMPLAIFGA